MSSPKLPNEMQTGMWVKEAASANHTRTMNVKLENLQKNLLRYSQKELRILMESLVQVIFDNYVICEVEIKEDNEDELTFPEPGEGEEDEDEQVENDEPGPTVEDRPGTPDIFSFI